ncbi:thioesterase family protein [Acidovorax sp. SUPP3334]|uniref:acyl-CoA thioesterase n=1 Tax=Acidovorax sp. SUPP3334 TaxID=2920881 RepID=UPI0023DE5600|nr:thioesterase family protein [Acidovorax sp. SUPP3334]GKT22057.1 thioesterase family protein [Acidovorax sp. SUPP3334]
MTSEIHPLDDALALQPAGPGQFTGRTTPAYWNMVGPFGGATAATLLQALMQHPDRLGEPLSLTVNYAGAVAEGPFTVHATPVRTNRSTQHWTLSIVQPYTEGAPAVTTIGTAVTAARRETWSQTDTPMPQAPHPDTLDAPPKGLGVAWLDRYELRAVAGSLPQQWDGSGDSSLTQLWMRDAPARPLDFCALAGLADVFFPRVWLRRAHRVPAGTVSLTVYFHAGSAQLAATGTGFLLGQARAQEFRNGFFDQTAQLWNEAGTMLASSHQIVYYKE